VSDKEEALMFLNEYVKANKGMKDQGKLGHKEDQHPLSSQEPPMQDKSNSKCDEEAERFPTLSADSKVTKGT